MSNSEKIYINLFYSTLNKNQFWDKKIIVERIFPFFLLIDFVIYKEVGRSEGMLCWNVIWNMNFNNTICTRKYLHF